MYKLKPCRANKIVSYVRPYLLTLDTCYTGDNLNFKDSLLGNP